MYNVDIHLFQWRFNSEMEPIWCVTLIKLAKNHLLSFFVLRNKQILINSIINVSAWHND